MGLALLAAVGLMVPIAHAQPGAGAPARDPSAPSGAGQSIPGLNPVPTPSSTGGADPRTPPSSADTSLAPVTPAVPPGTAPRLPPPLPPGEGPEISKASRGLAEFELRPIRAVELLGLKTVDPQEVRNTLRSTEGSPLREATVRSDVQNLNRRGKFSQISAQAIPYSDGTVVLRLTLVETPIVRQASAVGNRQISDQDLRGEINLLEGTPVDRYEIDRLVRRIKDLYRKRGYYQADVTIDEPELAERGNLIFQIREGERLKVTDIRFEGNFTFGDGRLTPSVKSETWGLFWSGALDDAVVDQDVATLIQFYKDRGFLDVRVDRRIQPSPDGKEAILTFVISEGQVYTLRSVRVELARAGARTSSAGEPPTVFSRAQLAGLMLIKPGDVYSLDKLRKSVEAVSDAYASLGYIDSTVAREELRDLSRPEVDLLLVISEGQPSQTGLIIIKGNDLTQQKVIRREVRLRPDRPLDGTALRLSKQALQETQLFAHDGPGTSDVKLTIQPPDDATPGYRDVLVEVEETNTGRLGFGAAVNTDLGLIGSIEFAQRNFDLYDLPDSASEFFLGRAFRGGAQSFNISLQPGTTYQNYSISLGEPRLFDSEYSGSVGGGYRRYKYDEYSEGRTSFNTVLGRRFGERWVGSVASRVESISLSNFQGVRSVDLAEVEGTSFLVGVGVRLSRTALDSTIRPTAGTRLDFSAERIFGDFNFTKLGVGSSAYIPLYEDFFTRKTVLTLRAGASLIPEAQGEAPLFERFYLGGRELRGFAFRGVSPRGIVAGSVPPRIGLDAVGGKFSMFTGAQVEQPLISETIAGVAFLDAGTVDDQISVSKYRVAVGIGLRLYLPQLGPAPLAFDIAVPLRKQGTDDRRFFSFSIDVPF
ncbi:outer membrane protein assembly factor BamA [soil metagenome]